MAIEIAVASGPVGDLLNHLCEVTRLHVLRVRHLESQAREVQAQLVETIGIRLRMHSVQSGDPVPANKLRGLHVRRDHAFLDQPVRVITGHGADALYVAVLRDVDPRLRDIQLDGATLAAVAREQSVYVVQVPDIALELARNGLDVLPRQAGIDLSVGKTGGGAHDGLVELRTGHLAVRSDPHFANHAQPVDAGVQGAKAVGQHFRQHRHDAIGKIDRRAAADCLLVEFRTCLDVVADVGNRHQEPEALARGLGEDRVVEVACVRAVDGHERH